MPSGRVIYDIPRSVVHDAEFDLLTLHKQREDGDVDYGPHYWIEYLAVFDIDVSATTAARVVGDYLAYNYQDRFMQAEVRSGALNEWTVRIHLGWGDRPYYDRITP